MFEYSNHKRVFLIHISTEHNINGSVIDILKQYIRGNSWVATATDTNRYLTDYGLGAVEYSNLIVYTDTVAQKSQVNKNFMDGLYIDRMPQYAREGYFKYQLHTANNPLEAIAIHAPYSENYQLSYAMQDIKDIIGQHSQSNKGIEYESCMVFLNIFDKDKMPSFFDAVIDIG